MSPSQLFSLHLVPIIRNLFLLLSLLLLVWLPANAFQTPTWAIPAQEALAQVSVIRDASGYEEAYRFLVGEEKKFSGDKVLETYYWFSRCSLELAMDDGPTAEESLRNALKTSSEEKAWFREAALGEMGVSFLEDRHPAQAVSVLLARDQAKPLGYMDETALYAAAILAGSEDLVSSRITARASKNLATTVFMGRLSDLSGKVSEICGGSLADSTESFGADQIVSSASELALLKLRIKEKFQLPEDIKQTTVSKEVNPEDLGQVFNTIRFILLHDMMLSLQTDLGKLRELLMNGIDGNTTPLKEYVEKHYPMEVFVNTVTAPAPDAEVETWPAAVLLGEISAVEKSNHVQEGFRLFEFLKKKTSSDPQISIIEARLICWRDGYDVAKEFLKDQAAHGLVKGVSEESSAKMLHGILYGDAVSKR